MDKSLSLLSATLEKAKQLGADACDVVMFNSTDLSVSCRMGKPEGLERAESGGMGLRVFVGDKQAFVSTTDMNTQAITEMTQRAVDMARVSPVDPYSTLAPSSLLATDVPKLDLHDDQEPAAEWLQEQCKIAEDAALGVKGITNSEGADAHYSSSKISLATSNGFLKSYDTSNLSLSVCVLAGSGTGMERDYDFTSVRHLNDLDDARTIGENAAKNTLRRLNPKKASSCNCPVIFDPRVAKNLLGSMAGAISGSAIARGTSFLKNHLGKQVFSSGIHITDDPHIVRGPSSRPFDAEGVANRKQSIVSDGVLNTWLLDIRSANKLGLTTTGHATRGLASPPSPSCTNLYMENGKESPEALIADIKQGIYITDVFGMGVNLITGDYSQGVSGIWIENGKLTYPVSEITIAGHLLTMFSQMTAANDLTFKYGVNTPSLRIDNMTIAGK